MVPRAIADLVRKRLRESPAVALVGARQSGKTTLARTLSDLCYDLEEPADRLRIEDQDDLLHHPAVGASWEGFVIEQVLDRLAAMGHAPQAFFFRASDGTEIDLVFRHRKALWAVEVKLTSAPSDGDFRKLDRAAELIGAGRRVLVSQTTQPATGRDRSSCTLPGLLRLLEE